MGEHIDSFEGMPLAAHGRLWLEPLRLWLGIADNEIVCYDEADQPLGNYVELKPALETARQARAAVEARLQELEAELRRLHGEQDTGLFIQMLPNATWQKSLDLTDARLGI
jgi:hypothetical protein